MFSEYRDRGFQLNVSRGVSQSWVSDILSNLSNLPPAEYVPQRRRGVMDLPSEANGCQAFIKVFHHTSPRHQKWRRRAPIQRLRPRYADHEGQALRQLAAAGIPVPRLFFYGEEWQFGIRQRGIVATELLSAPMLFEVLQCESHDRWINAYSKTLARIHTVGLSHGDAHSRNFLVHNSQLVAVDLENSRTLSHKKRTTDLVSMASSVLQATDSEELALRTLATYASHGGDTRRLSLDGLMRLASETAMGTAWSL